MLNSFKNKQRLNFVGSKILNRPLAMEAGAAAVVVDALAGRLGVVPIGASEEFGTEPVEQRDAEYEVINGVAVIPVIGELVQRGGYVGAMSGLTSYQHLVGLACKAARDPQVKAALLDIDSPGGEVAGMFDAADKIANAFTSAGKPLWAYSNERMFSAAYALGVVADKILVSRTSGVGSIGVIAMHVDRSAADEKEGIKVTPIFAGKTKADGSPHAPLSNSALNRIQGEINRVYSLFTDHCARYRGLSDQDIRDTEAMCFYGKNAIAEGLADDVCTFEDALVALFTEIEKKDLDALVSDPLVASEKDEDMARIANRKAALKAKQRAVRGETDDVLDDEDKKEEQARKAALKRARKRAQEEEDKDIDADVDDELDLDDDLDADENLDDELDDDLDAEELDVDEVVDDVDDLDDLEAEEDEDLDAEEDEDENREMARKAARARKAKTGNSARRPARESMKGAAEIAKICNAGGYPEMAASLLAKGASVADATRAVRANKQIERMIRASVSADPTLSSKKLQKAIVNKAAGNVATAQKILFNRIVKASAAGSEVLSASVPGASSYGTEKASKGSDLISRRRAQRATALNNKRR